MYKVVKAFIYRARLYSVGQELTEHEYRRMMRDKVAIKRGIPVMVASQESPLPSVQEKAKKDIVPAKETIEKPVVKEAQKTTQKAQKSVKPKEPATSAKKPVATKKPTTAKKSTETKKPVRKKQTTAKPKEE